MKIQVLVENKSRDEALGCEHGLSLYVEALGRRLLFDTGASPLFISNADKMGIDLSEVEFVIISHGHFDHGGGLEAFLQLNDRAEVFVHPLAFGDFFSKQADGRLRYIGLDGQLEGCRQLVYTTDRFTITRGIRLFSKVMAQAPLPSSNRDLMKKVKGRLEDDDFAHEQNLVIEEGDRMTLFSGCAHRGIVNIVEHFHSIKGRYPDVVIGGFHLAKGDEDRESDEDIERIASFLLSTGARYYTGHCTGRIPYQRLKEMMGDRVSDLATGDVLEIG